MRLAAVLPLAATLCAAIPSFGFQAAKDDPAHAPAASAGARNPILAPGPVPDISTLSIRPDGTVVLPNGTVVPVLIGPRTGGNGGGAVPNGTTLLWPPDANAAPPSIPSMRFDLDLNDARLEEALKIFFLKANQRYRIDKDVPKGVKVTLKVRNLTFVTALQAIVEQVHLSWSAKVEKGDKGAETIYTIGKQSTAVQTLPLIGPNYLLQYIPWPQQEPSTLTLPWSLILDPTYAGKWDPSNWWAQLAPVNSVDSAEPPTISVDPEVIRQAYGAVPALVSPWVSGPGGTLTSKVPVLSDLPLLGSLFTNKVRVEKSIFTCPRCHAQVTVIHEHETPTCPECGRPFQADWRVCPFDGAKRPVVSGEWRFCPICGKAIKSAESRK
jgi:hypothetical protein